VEALRCAWETQKEWIGHAIPVKIGLHVGDVVMEEGDVYGDGVNIASRVETLAVVGSVLMTERVISEIKGHPEMTFQSIGTFHFKNVSKPTEVFALNLEIRLHLL